MSAGAVTRTAAWAPLRHPAFRVVWLTFLGAQLANWSETVGAVDVIASQSDSVALLALVQAAATAPAVVLALPAGAAADLVDRRRLLVLVVAVMGAAMALLSVLTAADRATPAVVLALTLVMGAGIAVSFPAFSALIPDLVPRRDLAAGVTLTGISINLARAVGPALAGLALAVVAAQTLFAAIAAALGVMTLLLVVNARTGGAPPAQGQSMLAAIRAGVRFARTSVALRRVLTRGGAFVVPASALWAVLPAVAVQRLGLDAAAFGGILAALGTGAVLGAQLLPWLRARLGLDLLLRCGTVYGAVNLVLLALLDRPVPIVASLVVAGAAWIAVLSSLNTAAQLAAPAWVRGRALSVNQLVFSGGMAAGSALWGVVAQVAGLSAALLAAAALLALTLVLVRWWPLSAQDDEQRAGDEQGEPEQPLPGQRGGLEPERAGPVQER
jgi:MFS family permease